MIMNDGLLTRLGRSVIRRPDRLSGAVLVVVAIGALFEASGLPFGSLRQPDSGFFPKSLASLLLLFGVGIALKFICQQFGLCPIELGVLADSNRGERVRSLRAYAGQSRFRVGHKRCDAARDARTRRHEPEAGAAHCSSKRCRNVYCIRSTRGSIAARTTAVLRACLQLSWDNFHWSAPRLRLRLRWAILHSADQSFAPALSR